MGLTPQELVELLEYIEKNHSWKNMYDIHTNLKKGEKPPVIIKYVSFGFDTRDCDIWHIRFYNLMGVKEEEKVFRTEQGYNLKEEIYKWLKEARNSVK